MARVFFSHSEINIFKFVVVIRIDSNEIFLHLKIVDGVWDAVVQVLVRRASTSFSDSDTLCGTGFLVRRPPPVFGSTRPLLPPLVLAPLHLVADSDPEQIMVRLNYTFGAKPNEVVLLRCRRCVEVVLLLNSPQFLRIIFFPLASQSFLL